MRIHVGCVEVFICFSIQSAGSMVVVAPRERTSTANPKPLSKFAHLPSVATLCQNCLASALEWRPIFSTCLLSRVGRRLRAASSSGPVPLTHRVSAFQRFVPAIIRLDPADHLEQVLGGGGGVARRSSTSVRSSQQRPTAQHCCLKVYSRCNRS